MISHSKVLVLQDLEIHATNKKHRAALHLAAKAHSHMLLAQTSVAVKPANEACRMNLNKTANGKGKADDRYAKALEASVAMMGQWRRRAGS